MKRLKKLLNLALTGVLLLALTAPALAAEEEFVLQGSTLTGYNGPGGDIVIPDGVNRIDDFLFWGRTDITGVTFPDTLTRIGEEAFCECTGLTSLRIPGSVRSISERAFSGCTGLTEIVLEEGVEYLGEYAFGDCRGVRELTIPGSMTTVRDGFVSCLSLERLTLSPGVEEIDKGAFWDCPSLTELVIPDGVTRIGRGAFSACSGLKVVDIPDSVTQIDPEAFVVWRIEGNSPVGTTGPALRGGAGSRAESYAREWNLEFVQTGSEEDARLQARLAAERQAGEREAARLAELRERSGEVLVRAQLRAWGRLALLRPLLGGM